MTNRNNRSAITRSIGVGRIRVTWVPDGSVALKPHGWFPGTTDADWADAADLLDEDGNLVASVGAVLLQSGSRAMLIDAGFGPHDQADTGDLVVGSGRGGDLLTNLRRLGVQPADIEVIAITHLHTDHIGWAHTRVEGNAAFPQAAILVGEQEWAHREDRLHQGVSTTMLDRMTPRVQTVTDGRQIWPGVTALAMPGHTPGHTSYVITDRAERAIVVGDAMHSSIQISHPHWYSAPDTDPETAVAHRRRLISELATPGTTGIAGHFADTVFGRVAQSETGGDARWESVA